MLLGDSCPLPGGAQFVIGATADLGEGSSRVLGVAQQGRRRAGGGTRLAQQDDAAVGPEYARGTGGGVGQFGEAVPCWIATEGGDYGVGVACHAPPPVRVLQPLALRQ